MLMFRSKLLVSQRVTSIISPLCPQASHINHQKSLSISRWEGRMFRPLPASIKLSSTGSQRSRKPSQLPSAICASSCLNLTGAAYPTNRGAQYSQLLPAMEYPGISSLVGWNLWVWWFDDWYRFYKNHVRSVGPPSFRGSRLHWWPSEFFWPFSIANCWTRGE